MFIDVRCGCNFEFFEGVVVVVFIYVVFMFWFVVL